MNEHNMAIDIVKGMPNNLDKIDNYLMGLGNNRVEIKARQFFRPILVKKPFSATVEKEILFHGMLLSTKAILEQYKISFVQKENWDLVRV